MPAAIAVPASLAARPSDENDPSRVFTLRTAPRAVAQRENADFTGCHRTPCAWLVREGAFQAEASTCARGGAKSEPAAPPRPEEARTGNGGSRKPPEQTKECSARPAGATTFPAVWRGAQEDGSSRACSRRTRRKPARISRKVG
jgi:hypothetical protein